MKVRKRNESRFNAQTQKKKKKIQPCEQELDPAGKMSLLSYIISNRSFYIQTQKYIKILRFLSYTYWNVAYMP